MNSSTVSGVRMSHTLGVHPSLSLDGAARARKELGSGPAWCVGGNWRGNGRDQGNGRSRSHLQSPP
eukprot:4270552-Prymnesium_polylepis.2